ncbi:MAG: hypothetical protein MI784_10665 [Cytophagales bacterium]|nr:hypothetical protein [Cytophagales bacterium]
MYIIHRLSGEKKEAQMQLIGDREGIDSEQFGFPWKEYRHEFNQGEIYGLFVKSSGELVGLMSIEKRTDHVYVHLVEASRANMGKSKHHERIAGCMFAFAGVLASEAFGPDGYLLLQAKDRLISHYRKAYGFELGFNRYMGLYDEALRTLIRHYGKSI